jgi:hypothetical protein
VLNLNFIVGVVVLNISRDVSYKIHSLILFGLRKKCLIRGRSLILYQFTTDVTAINIHNFIEYAGLEV